MNLHHLSLLAALLGAALPLSAWAQASAPARTASAPAPLKPNGPRLLSPAEKRDNADAVASPDLRPEQAAVPQVSIPLGKSAGSSKPTSARTANKGATGGISDGAARCEAQATAEERAKCRKQQAHATPPN